MSNKVTKQILLDEFTKGINPNKSKKIGVEIEKIGIYTQTAKNPTYGGKNGYLAILGKLYEELGWKIEKRNGKFILQLTRGNSNINLESDGRIELAGSTHESIHDLAREIRIHQNEMKELSECFGIGWLGIGYHPVSPSKEIVSISEGRKKLLDDYFTDVKEKTGNDFGLAWYKKTAGIHVNIDYLGVNDFSRKAKAFTKIAPVLTAMFANSPFSRRNFTNYMSYRYHVTHNTGLPHFEVDKALFESDFDYEAWLNHVLELPLVMFEREGQWFRPEKTFNEFLQEGYEGYEANMNDFDLHTKTLWKDVKLKNVIELRSIDSLPPHYVPSVAALVKGLAYSEEAIGEILDITSSWSYHDYIDFQQEVAKHALKATINGTRAIDIAKRLLELAQQSLQKKQIQDWKGRNESMYLEPIKEMILVRGTSPARYIVEQWSSDWRKSLFPVIEWCQY